MNNVLVVVDMQNDFIDGSLGSPEAQAIVDNVAREINGKYNQIIYTKDTHYKDYLNTFEGKNLPVEHCIKDTNGWFLNENILCDLSKYKVDIIEKNTFGYLEWKNLIKEPDSITICGLCTDVCVVSNALILRAVFPNTPMYYVKDACAGITPETHEAACKVMESCQIYNKKVITVGDMTKEEVSDTLHKLKEIISQDKEA